MYASSSRGFQSRVVFPSCRERTCQRGPPRRFTLLLGFKPLHDNDSFQRDESIQNMMIYNKVTLDSEMVRGVRITAKRALAVIAATCVAMARSLQPVPDNVDVAALAAAWQLRITSPIANGWVESNLLQVGFTGRVPQGTDVSSLQVCVSLDGGGPSCMPHQNVVIHSTAQGAHSVVACWVIPGFGSCFDYAFTAMDVNRERVPGRDQVSFVVVHPFQHSAVQWVDALGAPLPHSV